MCNGQKLHLCSQVFAKVSYHNNDKQVPIIRDNSSTKSISAHNLLPFETENSLCCDFGNNFSFYPYGEIIDSNYQELQLTWCQGEWSQDVHAPLVERLVQIHRLEEFRQGMVKVIMSLTLITLFGKRDVILH